MESPKDRNSPTYRSCMLSPCSYEEELMSHECILTHQGPLSMGILQARILEWVAMPSSRGSFSTRGSNPGLLHCTPAWSGRGSRPSRRTSG